MHVIMTGKDNECALMESEWLGDHAEAGDIAAIRGFCTRRGEVPVRKGV